MYVCVQIYIYIYKHYIKFCMDFQLLRGSVPVTPTLFKGQL